MEKRKKGDAEISAYIIKGETWRYMYRWWPKDSGHHFTTVYLRKDSMGAGLNTHTVQVSVPPDMFQPFELDTTPLRTDPNPSFRFP